MLKKRFLIINLFSVAQNVIVGICGSSVLLNWLLFLKEYLPC